MLDPVIDSDGAPFWGHARQGELRVQACADCGEASRPSKRLVSLREAAGATPPPLLTFQEETA